MALTNGTVGRFRRLFVQLAAVGLLAALSGCFSTPAPHHHRSTHTHKPSFTSKPVIRYVRKNDTLYSIGKKFGIDYRVIARRNHIRRPYHIYVGQRLYIDRQAPASFDVAAQKIRHISRSGRNSSHTTRSKHHSTHASRKSASAHKSKAGGSRVSLRWPVSGVVTSPFGRRGSRMHDGIDIGAREGTPVHAAASGEIVYADSRLSGYGKLIIIRHGRDLFTAYGHNQRMLVRKGAKVRAGDVIGRVGHTGRASGPHLHFEVRQGSTPVNPLAYLPAKKQS